MDEKIIFLVLVCLIFGFLISSTSLAYTFTLRFPNPTKFRKPEGIINNFIDFIFKISLIVVPSIIIVAALIYATAGTDEKKIETVKKIVFYAIIGFAVVLFSRGIMALIKNLF